MKQKRRSKSYGKSTPTQSSVWVEIANLLHKAQTQATTNKPETVAGGTMPQGGTAAHAVKQQTEIPAQNKQTFTKVKDVLGHKPKAGTVGRLVGKPGVLPEGSGFPVPGQRLMTKKEIANKRWIKNTLEHANRLRKLRAQTPRRPGASGAVESTIGPFDIGSLGASVAKLGVAGTRAALKWGAKKLAKEGGKSATKQIRNLTDDAVAAARGQSKVRPKTTGSVDPFGRTGTMPKIKGTKTTGNIRGGKQPVDPFGKTYTAPTQGTSETAKQVWKNKLAEKIKTVKDLRTQGASPSMVEKANILRPGHMDSIKRYVLNKIKSDPKLRSLKDADYMAEYSRMLSEMITKAIQHDKGYQKALLKYMGDFYKSWGEAIDILKSICGVGPFINSSWEGANQILKAMGKPKGGYAGTAISKRALIRLENLTRKHGGVTTQISSTPSKEAVSRQLSGQRYLPYLEKVPSKESVRRTDVTEAEVRQPRRTTESPPPKKVVKRRRKQTFKKLSPVPPPTKRKPLPKAGTVGQLVGLVGKPGVLPEGSGFPVPGQRLMTKKKRPKKVNKPTKKLTEKEKLIEKLKKYPLRELKIKGGAPIGGVSLLFGLLHNPKITPHDKMGIRDAALKMFKHGKKSPLGKKAAKALKKFKKQQIKSMDVWSDTCLLLKAV